MFDRRPEIEAVTSAISDFKFCLDRMGGGRKTKTRPLKEKSQPCLKTNCSAPARNLRKSDLGAVIFGCKNHTIKECYSEELFGLPSLHFAYVKKITPGLTLFLFNYSDRKLHGIFEATSPGQMNINPNGWIDDCTEHTPYPAQVQVRIQRWCCTLTEDQFGPIIAGNYFEEKLFWFELDRDQTSKLIALFTSLPYNEGSSPLKNSTKWKTFFYSLPTSDTKLAGADTRSSVLEANHSTSDQTNAQWSLWDARVFHEETDSCENSVDTEAADGNLNMNGQPSYASVLSNNSVVVSDTTFSIPQKKWSSLFKTDSDSVRKDENFRTQASNSDQTSDQSNMKLEASCVAPSLDRESSVLSETQEVELVAGQDCEEFDTWESIWEHYSAVTKAADSLPQITSFDDAFVGETRDEHECFEAVSSDLNIPHSEESNMELASSCFLPHLDGETQLSEASTDYNAEEAHAQEKPNCDFSYSSTGINEMTSEENHEKDSPHPSFASGEHLENGCSPVADILSTTNSSDIQSVVVKLMQEIEGLKVSQLKQIMKISSLGKELVESKVQIQQLKNRCNVLESGAFSAVGHVGEEYGQLDRSFLNKDEFILIVGGFDGSSWLSALDSYSPSHDIMLSLCPMTFVRSYASAAKLNSELFIFGGVGDDVWYDTVESYNLTSDHWVNRPSLNKKKGSLAGAFLNDKIFAIGGGNGVDCFSEVEMFDPNVGRWIFTQSMQYKRFAPAAAEINNSLYVTGGYDGRNYLSSVERFDPREHSWTGLGNMSTRRGCHSVVVLDEKLYALGGYDGSNMVSAVEVFDPRNGSWMTGEPMNNPRGYSGTVVIGEKIYIIGGINDSGEILDTIECYKQGYGWEVTNLNAIKKRCFFSALVF